MNIKMFNENNLPHELLLTTRKTTKFRNAIENNMPTSIKLSKTQISKRIQSERFLGSLLSKIERQLMKVAVPLVKNILAPLGITAAGWTIDAGISREIYSSGTTTLIILDEKINNILKTVQAIENSNVLLKGITKQLRMRQKNKKEDF